MLSEEQEEERRKFEQQRAGPAAQEARARGGKDHDLGKQSKQAGRAEEPLHSSPRQRAAHDFYSVVAGGSGLDLKRMGGGGGGYE